MQTIFDMTPWETIEEALQRRRPAAGPKWLSERLADNGLKVSLQAIGHWKTRGVPSGKYRVIAQILGLTVDQIEGLAPLPWDTQASWPFPDASLHRRLEALTHDQRVEIQAKIREMVEKFEDSRAGASGKLSTSQNATPRTASRQ